jgi:phage N-6-adenine-methyltransferase
MAKKSNGHAIIGAQVADQRDAIWLSSESNEWYTPAQYIEAARQVMGDIDIDPASNTTANETVKAAEYYTKDTNGLEHHWKGRVWLNPPYGGLSGPFVSKLMEEIRLGNVQQAVVLVNANSTETNWFAPLWCHTLCFTNHRIDFVSPGGAKNGSTHGSVFIYVGPNKYEFARAFRQFGFVVEQVVLPVIATIGQEALKIA